MTQQQDYIFQSGKLTPEERREHDKDKKSIQTWFYICLGFSIFGATCLVALLISLPIVLFAR